MIKTFIIILGIVAMSECVYADEEQPWLIDRPEEVVEEVEAPVENFWGYAYFPIVITWYGEHVPKFKHELEPFRAYGAAADNEEAAQQCEYKIDEIETLFSSNTDPEFASAVVCLGRYFVKPAEEEEDET